ncbi:spondin-1 [Wyeomyia smithii]|uniref:spondin-1 n=1 Tax=Wyeomyia smithii TaxID=174621 RepID=UPI002467F2C9|nr:spondin-1 [Wyeomyia smithii]XP_055530254.1 spondin-1 [Wyeomyia smithii]XP_055530255.1 spondin-1 [Wyeomyia smithii]XP_055530256.1 spondin-1 [Wyeomyia smithii]XP_055530257.1 spondin-1 [Wyeomyia smithii]XP_055530258.1 spondin-1 [Wyeomyia smithii]XP_055530259.1 spondin-1 [Wyeomyia smithii]XP_055530260.1 spondin-1 [Wyeomyia smithii]XP_055530261.1 spondin-1 [Wyeomyia smithii]
MNSHTTATASVFRAFRASLVFGLLILLIGLVGQHVTDAIRCDRTPEGAGASKSPADGRFRLRISGNPEKYVPGASYTISLVGIRSMQVPHKFSGFFLAAEKEMSLIRPDQSLNGDPHTVGTFHLLGDGQTKFSERCPNAVTQTSSIPKSEIQVNWVAPPARSGCIAIRATVVEHRDVWYMDDGPLSKILCEDEADSVDTQPAVLKECCACDEAKYELTFEGLWSRHTHPKDFPSNGWLTRFSDVIGASHTVDYRFWEYGQIASEGLKQVAEHGSTRTLESELKNESAKIRTIIKARGISYPNVTGKTFAVFRVDSNHHLVSIVSMIDPSPDWIVGVSGLELCLSNCTWIENKILNLYPWDAGTDGGPTYISPDQPNNPPDVIRRIKANHPNDPRSPFYDPTGAEMKPLARIYLSRQRLYEKNCDVDNEEDSNEKQACETEPWGEWTECSSRCNKGKQFRRRIYKHPLKATNANCKRKLTDRRPCVGQERDCDFVPSQEMDENYPSEGECEVTEWGPWSECSTPCGKGNKTRSRKYKKKGARKKCERLPSPPVLQQTMPCSKECAGDISQPVISADINPKCRMTQWSEWGPCSVTCGLGRMMRTRMPISLSLNTRLHHKRFVNYYLTKRRPVANDEDEEEEEEDDPDNSMQITDPNDPCYGVETVEEVTCGHDLPPCESLYGVPELCYLEPKPGNCRDSQPRWYFDNEKNDCSMLFFTGCGGNNNNFMSREDCLDTCSKDRKFTNIPIRDQISTNSDSDFKRDCKTSHWRHGPCNATCGEGFRLKSRTILSQPINGGQRCPRKLRKVERCFVHCDSSRHDTNPSWGPSTRYSPEPIECEYSAWSAWSPCSKTCGDFAVQQRTRYVLNPENARHCPHRLEERKCDIMPCLLGK